ncbi:p-loop containing nucleoside triphosphate hydrolase superfamily protein, partial [Thalictrum thalictroides]
VSASDWRNGVQMKQKFGAAMDSLGLNKWSLEDPLDLRMKCNLELPSTQTSKSSVQEFGDEIVEVFPVTCKEESDNFKEEPGKVVDTDYLTANSRGADKTLILFEDVDIVFDEDRGLISSIQQIAETAKRPIILTSNSKDPVLPNQLDRLEVYFTIPSPEELLCHVNMVCAAEQADIHPHLLQRLINSCQGDIRKTIMLLQFWCQSKINKKESKLQSTYGPHCFDLDAGHQILPKVLPWEFPCQLSELVEKEIMNSLLMVEKSASLVDIVEEEERSSKEMEDVLQINIKAKKEAMLKRNHSVDDGSGIPVLFDNLDDFSNSSGSLVACTWRTSRRRSHRVLSSHSEDDFCTDKILIDLNFLPVDHCSEDEFYSDRNPKGSDILCVDHCNGVFPDVSHGSVAHRDPSTGQLNHPEKKISMENPFDPFPAETDQHPCETYKSVDISCVPESSFVAETEINDGVELLSDTVSCGCAAARLEPLSLSTAKSTESLSVSIQKAVQELDNNSETILGNTCEVDSVSVHKDEEVGDSQHEHAESVTRRYQMMDECSRAGLNMSSISWESRRCMGQVGTVPATWRRLSCCRADLSSYVTSEQRNASQIVKLASGLTDLISAADLMFGRCQSLISDFLEPPMVPCTEPDAFSWYDEQLEMTSTISQHGFCFYANESAARGSYSGFKSSVDLSSELLASSTNTTVFGKLLTQDPSQNSYLKKDAEIRPTRCTISLKREIERQFCNMIQNVVPPKMYLASKGVAFHEYMSSLGQISKSEVLRLSENIDKKKLQRRARVARHYLSSGPLTLSPEDLTFLAQHSCFGKILLE